MRLAFFTSITNSYFSKARVLARSVKSFYPESEFVLALLDSEVADLRGVEPSIDRVLTIGENDVDNFRQWIYFHDVVEACTAQKGLVIESLLLEDRFDAVIYLDPDIKVFSRLTELEEALEKHSVVLTPHLTTPSPTDAGVQDNELAASIHGTYNLGFLALKNTEQGLAVATWWKNRLLKYCFDEKERGIFTDQKWFDLVPALFDDVFVLRHPGYNIATWNIENRRISREGEFLSVNQRPVRFVHFSGYDSGAHMQMLDRYASDQPEFRALSLEYAEELDLLRVPGIDDKEWVYRRNKIGQVIQRDWRRRYRDDSLLRSSFGDPFVVSGEALRRFHEVDPLSRAIIAGKHPAEILSIFESLDQSNSGTHLSGPVSISDALMRISSFLSNERPTIGMISHGLGGGVEVHLAELVSLVISHCNVVIFSVTKSHEHFWVLKVSICGVTGSLIEEQIVSETDTLFGLIENIGCSRFHVHSVFGSESFWLPYLLAASIPFDVTIHDYALLTDNWSMNDESGGTLSLKKQDEMVAAVRRQPQRLEAIEEFLGKAARVIFPSQSSRERFSAIIGIREPVTAYHPEFPPPELIKRQPFRRPSIDHVMKIGILGDLASHKGLAQVIDFITFGLRNDLSFEVHHFGAPHPALNGEVTDHGRYIRRELPKLVSDASIDLIWLPSQVHETYGYAVSDALMTRLPIVASSVGAYPERLSGAELVSVLPPDAKAEEVWETVRRLFFEGEPVWIGAGRTGSGMLIESRSFYPNRYLEPLIKTEWKR
jgi:glycosyltransferase involved in cell wall biosynthesis